MERSKPLPAWITGSIVCAVFGALFWFERKRPLRRSVEPKARRDARNLTVAALGAVSLVVAERPLVAPLAALVGQRRWGLLQRVRLPLWLEVAVAALLMDYTLYVWHVLVHKVPWLWRFHVVHHVDLDLDASTAIRFHFGELMQSAPYRAAQVMLIGVTPLSLSVWQTALLASILFHHSNLRLPAELERHLNRFIVTPRMHGIHHSIVRNETDSNWSSGLTIWDRLHGTLKLDRAQDEITIGVPAYQHPEDVSLTVILAMPFEEQRDAWEGGAPHRESVPPPVID